MQYTTLKKTMHTKTPHTFSLISLAHICSLLATGITHWVLNEFADFRCKFTTHEQV